ncbi:MAG: FkbM family methyltransferase [Deltaproteobacteria bacterium]|nr:FkbM family methyltransferase [Deltaproteobacteria bacterium]
MALFDKLKGAFKPAAPKPVAGSILHALLKPARLTRVVDIGANPIDGDPPYKPMLGQGLCEVVGFEPQAEALAKLQAAKGPHERYLPYAIGDGGTHTLHICRASGMTSLLTPDKKTLAAFPFLDYLGHVEKELQIPTKRLDDVEEVSALDLLKIDVQGAEVSVFRGATKKLASAVAIQTEVSFLTLYENQATFAQVDQELRGMGFLPHCFAAVKHWPIGLYLHDEGPKKPVQQLLEADVVYVRDFIHPEALSNEQLVHLALIAEHVYGSVDLVLRCLMLLEARKAVAADAPDQYIGSLRAQGHAATIMVPSAG